MFTKIKKVKPQFSENIFYSVNTVEDTEHASDLEKKHLPIITAPKKIKKGEQFEVTIEAGKLLKHPNETGHFIQFIELYAEDTYLARMDLTAKTTEPIMKISVILHHSYEKLRAYIRCNLHGTWVNEIEIEMK